MTKFWAEKVKSVSVVRLGWRRFLQVVGGVTLITVASGGVFCYYAQKDRTPGLQLPHDPEKKTLVVLGSGWGATSLLSSLDTDDYNVVRRASFRSTVGLHQFAFQIVISPKNYFLFTPLLPSVAVGTLSPRSVIQRTLPLRASSSAKEIDLTCSDAIRHASQGA